ncbi:MAG: GIY-YIG nuclease family protein [Firmicutes bacterium]|nr:GIY-YIG nuclease family protein [Bacillota bacterium]
MPPECWYVYILRCNDDTLYAGCAANPQARLQKHNLGVASKYTRSRLPVQMVYSEVLPDRSSALRREKAIKALSRRDKLLLISESDKNNGRRRD